MNPEEQKPAESNTAPIVNDVAAPVSPTTPVAQPAPSEVPLETLTEASTAPAIVASENFSTKPEFTEPPADTTPEVATPVVAGEPAPDSSSATHGVSTAMPAVTPVLTASDNHKHSRKLLVLVATLVGLLLAAAVVFIYLKSNKSASPVTSKPTTTAATVSQQQTVSSKEVDTAVADSQKDVDSISDTDFADTVLSDSALGL